MRQSIAHFFQKPIAHRGFHNKEKNIIENSMSAFKAAAQKGYAIECDVLLSKDKHVMVFHDESLERLTNKKGKTAHYNAQALSQMKLRANTFSKESKDTIPILKEVLETIKEPTLFFIELKSSWDHKETLTLKTLEACQPYRNRVALMSFDPFLIKKIREYDPTILTGLVADNFSQQNWPYLSVLKRFSLRFLITLITLKVDFIAYDAKILEQKGWKLFLLKRLCRWKKIALISWTVRNEAQYEKLRPHLQQIIFENFTPDQSIKSTIKNEF